MRELPKTTYSGLTVILDKPSRFDKDGLISGYAGNFFNECLISTPSYLIHRGNIEVRTLDDRSELLDNTKCLLLLGPETIKQYNPSVTLNEQRGSPFIRDGITCIASYQPQDAYDRKAYEVDDESDDEEGEGSDDAVKSTHGKTQRKNWRFWLRQDIRKVVRLTREPLVQSSPEYHYWPTLEEIIRILTTTKGQDFYFDIETDSELQMTCFGFSLNGGKDVYVVPMIQTHHKPREYFYGELGTAKVLQALTVTLRDNTPVIHNAMFDLFVLIWRYGLPIHTKPYDTMLAHNRLCLEVEKSLGHVISLYTDLPYHKNEGVYEPHDLLGTQQLYEYNGKDVYAMTLVKPKIEEMSKKLKAESSIQLANRMVLPYLTVILQGMKLDTNKINSIADEHSRKNLQIERMMRILTGTEFNLNSPQQVGDYLYGNTKKQIEGLGLKKPEKDPTNEKTLQQILLKVEVPAIHCILQYRGNRKRISKVTIKSKRDIIPRYWYGIYTNQQLQPRLTGAYNLAGPNTMRLSCRKLLSSKSPFKSGYGDNTQNWEKYLRKIVIPDEGKVLTQIDQAGAEALIVAYLCRPGKFRDLFIHGIKPHIFVALHLFSDIWSKMPEIDNQALIRCLVAEPKHLKLVEGWSNIEKIIKDSDNWESERRYYYIAKQTCHSANYDIKARSFRLNTLQKSNGAVVLSHQQAEQYLEKYHKLFPEIREWHTRVVIEVRRTGILRNLFGHPRLFTGFKNESEYKEWYAFIAQSTVGQLTNIAITELQERLEAGDELLTLAGLDVLGNCHDSILNQNYPEHQGVVDKELQRHMNRLLVSPTGEEFYMKSEVKTSKVSWGDC